MSSAEQSESRQKNKKTKNTENVCLLSLLVLISGPNPGDVETQQAREPQGSRKGDLGLVVIYANSAALLEL